MCVTCVLPFLVRPYSHKASPLITISTHLSRSKLSDLLATLSLGLSCQPQVEQIFKHQSFLFVVWWDEKIFDELFHICSLGLIK